MLIRNCQKQQPGSPSLDVGYSADCASAVLNYYATPDGTPEQLLGYSPPSPGPPSPPSPPIPPPAETPGFGPVDGGGGGTDYAAWLVPLLIILGLAVLIFCFLNSTLIAREFRSFASSAGCAR